MASDPSESLVKVNNGTGFIAHRDDSGTYVITCRHVATNQRPGEPDATKVLLNGDIPVDQVSFDANSELISPELRADLVVLRCTSPRIASLPPLPLGKPLAPREYLIVSFKEILLDGKSRPTTCANRHSTFSSPHQSPSGFALKNDTSLPIRPGDSGSPVIDEETGWVVGIVTDVTASKFSQAETRDDLVVTASIGCLENWAERPKSLIVKTPVVPAQVKTRSTGATFANPVRILVAVSDGLDNELAILKEVIYRTQESPAARSFPVNLIEWPDFERELNQCCRLTEAGRRGKLLEFDAIVSLTLPSPEPLEKFASFTRLEESTRDPQFENERGVEDLPYRFFYRITEKEKAPTDKPISNPESDDLRVTSISCSRVEFHDSFWNDYQELLPNLVKTLRPHMSRTAVAVPESKDVRKPYVGLESFDHSNGNAIFFHGRTNEVSELRDLLVSRGGGFLAVLGPSGSGKSSLVKAGLVYRLEKNGIPGSDKWPIAKLRPAEKSKESGEWRDPLVTLAWHLNETIDVQFRYDSAVELGRVLSGSGSIEEVVSRALKRRPPKANPCRLLILIDQFEELFTVIRGERQQSDFLHAIKRLALQPEVNVIATMRDDYYSRLLQTTLSKLDGVQNPYFLKPADDVAQYSMVAMPAALSGFVFESNDLVLRILRDAGTGVGSLPLLSYALENLVKASTYPNLTWKAYKKIGGVQGVIQKQADEAKKGVDPKVLNRLFRRLIHVDEQGIATKKAASFDPTDPGWTEEERRLKDSLVDKRLLFTHELTGEESLREAKSRVSVEIAHEALINHWPPLKKWIEESKDDLRLIQRVQNAADEWSIARKKACQKVGKRSPDDERELAGLKVDHVMLWPQERINDVHRALDLLGIRFDSLSKESGDFCRPESARLLLELEVRGIGHVRRGKVGERLAEVGDKRDGVGLAGEKPDIVWCESPGRKITIRLQNNSAFGTFEVEPFQISRYPVTMCQFDAFANPKVYFQEQWWEGLAATPGDHPVYPQKPGTANHPAQFVSWYQSIAFCKWLSDQLGCEITLPTEAEWVCAATGGNESYLYPWGAEWEPDRANHAGGARTLMSVGMYPQGRSPIGVDDMSGNMFEWCLNEFDHPEVVTVTGSNPRVTRGGAYFSSEEELTVRHRLRDNANGVNDANRRIGACMRLVRRIPKSG